MIEFRVLGEEGVGAQGDGVSVLRVDKVSVAEEGVGAQGEMVRVDRVRV